MAERREYCPTNEKQIPAKGENRWNCSNFCWVTLEIWLQIQRIGRRRGRLGEAGGGSWLIFCCDPIPYKASCNKTRLYLQSTSNLCFQYNTYLHLDRRWQCLAYFHGSSYPFFIPVSMCVCVCVSPPLHPPRCLLCLCQASSTPGMLLHISRGANIGGQCQFGAFGPSKFFGASGKGDFKI